MLVTSHVIEAAGQGGQLSVRSAEGLATSRHSEPDDRVREPYLPLQARATNAARESARFYRFCLACSAIC